MQQKGYECSMSIRVYVLLDHHVVPDGTRVVLGVRAGDPIESGDVRVGEVVHARREKRATVAHDCAIPEQPTHIRGPPRK